MFRSHSVDRLALTGIWTALVAASIVVESSWGNCIFSGQRTRLQLPREWNVVPLEFDERERVLYIAYSQEGQKVRRLGALELGDGLSGHIEESSLTALAENHSVSQRYPPHSRPSQFSKMNGLKKLRPGRQPGNHVLVETQEGIVELPLSLPDKNKTPYSMIPVSSSGQSRLGEKYLATLREQGTSAILDLVPSKPVACIQLDGTTMTRDKSGVALQDLMRLSLSHMVVQQESDLQMLGQALVTSYHQYNENTDSQRTISKVERQQYASLWVQLLNSSNLLYDRLSQMKKIDRRNYVEYKNFTTEDMIRRLDESSGDYVGQSLMLAEDREILDLAINYHLPWMATKISYQDLRTNLLNRLEGFINVDRSEEQQLDLDVVREVLTSRLRQAFGEDYAPRARVTTFVNGNDVRVMAIGSGKFEKGSKNLPLGLSISEIGNIRVNAKKVPVEGEKLEMAWSHEGKPETTHLIVRKTELKPNDFVPRVSGFEGAHFTKDRVLKGLVVIGSNISGMARSLLGNYREYYEFLGYKFSSSERIENLKSFIEEHMLGRRGISPIDYFIKEAHADTSEQVLFTIPQAAHVVVGILERAGHREEILLASPIKDGDGSQKLTNREFGQWVRARDQNGSDQFVYVNASCRSFQKVRREILEAKTNRLINIGSRDLVYTFTGNDGDVVSTIIDGIRSGSRFSDIRQILTQKNSSYRQGIGDGVIFPDEAVYEKLITRHLKSPFTLELVDVEQTP